MKTELANNHYSPAEEFFNVSSHAAGLCLSVIALILLVIRAVQASDVLSVVSSSIFGISLVLLYLVSTLYHKCSDPDRRSKLRVYDHISIYILIAGTYTPFALLIIQGMAGWAIAGISWGLALAGTGLKLLYTGRFRLLSTLMYLLMGWLVVFAITPLTDRLPAQGLDWLLTGGICYTVGAVLYSFRQIPFNHAIFHVFVLLGSFCHFISVGGKIKIGIPLHIIFPHDDCSQV